MMSAAAASSSPRPRWIALVAIVALCGFAPPPGEKSDWIDLISGSDLSAWKPGSSVWKMVGKVELDPKNPRMFRVEEGTEALYNGPLGRTANLLTREDFQDVELELEFMLPKGSNSGVKLMGLYEIQLIDSFGVKKPRAMDCGGIYPRAELLPRYHYLDEGVPPKVNACLEPGTWQKLELSFRAPRFDKAGKKTQCASFVRVALNGKLIHEKVELKTPTGHAWHEKEMAAGPILLQGDHGPCAFRNMKVRRLAAD